MAGDVIKRGTLREYAKWINEDSKDRTRKVKRKSATVHQVTENEASTVQVRMIFHVWNCTILRT